ncbi:hypothetical protein HDU76_010984 [Blyttiomyces sp. JEL0837]|nr:hypothetical protein HDU76_010984 [Blyttiomyces sp. JEL0837]
MAVEKALSAMFPDIAYEVKGVKVASGIPDQPMSDEETITGAKNRALRSLQEVDGAEFGVGLEGGIQKIGDKYFEGGWIAVVDWTGKTGVGCSARYELSAVIMEGIFKGNELAVVIDELTGESDVRSKMGAMGVITNGLCNRDVCYIHGVYFAFAPCSPAVMSSQNIDQDSMTTSVAELAAEAKKDEAKRATPHIPIAAVVLILVVICLGAVTGPLGAIISINSSNNIQDLSNIITSQAVDGIYNQVQDVMDQPRKLLQIVNTNQVIQNTLLNNVVNLRNETQTYLFLKQLVNTSIYVNGITCLTYPISTDPYPNITQMSIYQTSDSTYCFFMDRSTGPYLWVGAYYAPLNRFVGFQQNYPFNYAYTMLYQPTYLNMLTSPPKTEPYFSWSTNHGDLISSIGQNVFVPSISTTHPVYACGVGFLHRISLDPLFSNIKVTSGTHVFLMDTSTNGTLMANSVPNSIFYIRNTSDPQLPVSHYTPDTTNDTTVAAIGGFLKGMYGSYGTIPNTGKTETFSTPLFGQTWIINYKYLNNPDTWLRVVAIPRADFFAKTDEASKKAIIIAVCIGVAGLLFAGLASWIAMRPLQTLTAAMEKLTKMDFSALEGDILNDRSFMTEVRKLQTTFALMCKAFASGIKKNKSLIGGKPGGTGGGSSQQTNSQNSAAVSSTMKAS